MDNSFKSNVEGSKSLLILLPTNPYFDQAAAGLSLYLVFKDAKQVTIASPSPMLVEHNRLIGVDKITSEIGGSENLTIKFSSYRADDVERVSYDIESGEFKLTVIPKEGKSSPTKDQVNLHYSGAASDTVIIIGGANDSHFPNLAEMKDIKLIHVGTRDVTLSAHKPLSFASAASSVSEIVAKLIKEMGHQMSADIATNLLMGIEEGSKNFSHSEVGADTFELLADLMRLGGRRISAQMPADKKSFPKGSIPGETLVPQPSFQATQPAQPKNEQAQSDNNTPKSWLEPKIYKGTTVS